MLRLSRGGVYVVDRMAVIPGGRDLVDELTALSPHLGRPRREMQGLGARQRQLARTLSRVWVDDRLVGDAEMGYPPLPLRRYVGEITLGPGGLAIADGVVLPDSFRWHLAKQLRHPALEDLAPHAARPWQPPGGPHLKGSYYHFDYANSGHYGHLMTEAVAKLWGWPQAKAADPDLKLLSRVNPRDVGRNVVPPDIDVLVGFGVDPDDIVRVHGWVTVDTLVAAAPMWHNHEPFHAHPDLAGIWERLRSGLVHSDVAAAPRIFVSRREGHRRCHNVEEVEAEFRAAGFRIILPGALSRAEQAAVFSGARVVAGFAGTGMFNLAYSHQVEQVILLSQDAYDARNEHLFAAVHGSAIDYLWSPADISHPAGGRSYEAFQSPWSFDFERNRAALHDAIDGLDRVHE